MCEKNYEGMREAPDILVLWSYFSLELLNHNHPYLLFHHNYKEAKKHTSHVVTSLYHLLNPQQPPCIHYRMEEKGEFRQRGSRGEKGWVGVKPLFYSTTKAAITNNHYNDSKVCIKNSSVPL